MQPYLLPYLPYFQLAHAVETFWVLDDVQFIRRGWMNRNRILLNGTPHQITFPLAKAPRDTLIRNMRLADQFAEQMERLTRTLDHAYCGAPCYSQLDTLLHSLKHPISNRFIDVVVQNLHESFDHLGLSTKIKLSSELKINEDVRGQSRIVEICRAVGANRYVNPIGGQTLYETKVFAAHDIELLFLKGNLAPYPQMGSSVFEPGLSILDVVANLPSGDVATQFANYELVTNAQLTHLAESGRSERHLPPQNPSP